MIAADAAAAFQGWTDRNIMKTSLPEPENLTITRFSANVIITFSYFLDTP
jgi:hypothetical protein